MNITGTTELLGVIGFPVKHSLSPVFQNAALSYMGLNMVYLPFEIRPENLRDAVRGLMLAGVRGLNVTVPHKEAVLELADWLSDEVREIGAANTLKFSEGRIEAYNTDWMGFLRAVREVVDVENRKVLVLGAGGASRAVLYALKKAGAQILLWNRTREKAVKLADRFGVRAVDSVEEAIEEAEVIVNTTSVGLKEDDPPLFDYGLIKREHVVIDLIYRETPLIRTARERGCSFQTGFPMLVYQGAESFRIWTGCEPPLKIMKLSLKDYGYPTESSRTLLRT